MRELREFTFTRSLSDDEAKQQKVFVFLNILRSMGPENILPYRGK